MSQEEINAMLVERGLAGQRVVRLKGGDPFVFGRGGEEALALAEAGVPCTVIPGITSAIGGLAAAGVPVTHRAVATSFAVVTGHEDPTKPAEGVDWSRLATAVDTIVVLMGVGRLDGIATAMIDAGRPADTPAMLVQHATLPQQRSVSATLGTIAEVAREAGIRAPALFAVGDVAALQPSLDPRHLAPLAGLRVLVTRTRAQASTLVDALRLEGAHPIELPAIEIQRRLDPVALAGAIEGLRAGRYQWTVFTSANAVEVFLDALLDAGEDARTLGSARVAAIGPATTDALASRALRPDVTATDATGEGMLDTLLAVSPDASAPPRILLPRAEGARDVLPVGLRACGATVDELTSCARRASTRRSSSTRSSSRTDSVRNAIDSMPGQYQLSLDQLAGEARSCARSACARCCCSASRRSKDARAPRRTRRDGIVQQAMRALKDSTRPGHRGRCLPLRVHGPRPLRHPHTRRRGGQRPVAGPALADPRSRRPRPARTSSRRRT
jgi:uroporphyrin-III C-methyltransferase